MYNAGDRDNENLSSIIYQQQGSFLARLAHYHSAPYLLDSERLTRPLDYECSYILPVTFYPGHLRPIRFGLLSLCGRSSWSESGDDYPKSAAGSTLLRCCFHRHRGPNFSANRSFRPALSTKTCRRVRSFAAFGKSRPQHSDCVWIQIFSSYRSNRSLRCKLFSFGSKLPVSIVTTRIAIS